MKIARAITRAVAELLSQGDGDFFLDRDGQWTLHATPRGIQAKTVDPKTGKTVVCKFMVIPEELKVHFEPEG